MPDEGKKRMTVWVSQQDRDDMRLIAESVGLSSDSAALRYAVRQLAKQIRVSEARGMRAGR